MFAIRQIIEDTQEVIPIPYELRHRRVEVIFIALDPESEQPSLNPAPTDAVDAFRGKGKGGAVARLLLDRQSDREKEQ
jgi:hypothetical protein